jgi:hypothetical protein
VACLARPVLGVQRRGVAGVAARGRCAAPHEVPAIYTAVSSDFKNLKVREYLDAAENAALQRVFAMAETEAEMDDDFSDHVSGEPAGCRRRA